MSQNARVFITRIVELCKNGQLKPSPAIAKAGEEALASLTDARQPVQGSGADGKGITEKQANFLAKLLDACDITLEQAVDATVQVIDVRGTGLEDFEDGHGIASLSKFGASKVIDYLVQLKDGRPPDPRGLRREGYGKSSEGHRPPPKRGDFSGDELSGDIPF